MQTHIALFTALADQTRLRIVEFLRQGERPVGEIVEDIGIHQSGVSRHLGILHEAGVVRVRPAGQRRLYSLRPEPFHEVDAWIASYRSLWEARLDRFDLELQRQAKRKPRTPKEQS
jgi:DNA-binding transcriptional ArsR family regulator